MRIKTHRVAARAACRFLDMNPDRTRIFLAHSMDPDHNLRFMNRFVKKIRRKNPEVFKGSKRYWIKDAFTLHTHDNASFYSLYFARLSKRTAEIGLQLESDILLAYGLHYLIDCATPAHTASFASLRDFISRRHRRYEDHLDDSISAGTLDLAPPLWEGLGQGARRRITYAGANICSLTRFSRGLHEPLMRSVKFQRMGEAEEITTKVFKRLGVDMGLFLNSYRRGI